MKPALVIKAFADETRLRILRLLGSRELCVCELVAALAVPQSTASRHLAYLQRTGLVSRRDDGRWSWYRVAAPPTELHRRLLSCVRGCLDAAIDFDKDERRLRVRERACP